MMNSINRLNVAGDDIGNLIAFGMIHKVSILPPSRMEARIWSEGAVRSSFLDLPWKRFWQFVAVASRPLGNATKEDDSETVKQ
jgi:hypothetical protein